MTKARTAPKDEPSGDPLRDDPKIPESREHEDEAWQRAFRYAVKKGNYVRAGEEGEDWREENRYKGAIVYADNHANDFIDSETPVVVKEAQ